MNHLCICMGLRLVYNFCNYCLSLLDRLFTSGRLILSLESIHYGRQRRILLMDSVANIGIFFKTVFF